VLERVGLGLRAEHLVIRELRDSHATKPPLMLEAPAEVRELELQGHETLARLATGPHNLIARLPAEARIRVGDRVTVGLDLTHAVWFDPESGAALR
jgi:ABC-type sugar transport system ATPase subunit